MLKIYMVVHVLPVFLFKMKQLRKQPCLVLWKALKNVIKSTLFFSTFVGSLRLLFCYVSWLMGAHSRSHAWIVGAIASLCFKFESASRQLDLALYDTPKCLESVWNMLVRRGYLFSLNKLGFQIFVLCMGLISIAMGGEKESLVSLNYRNTLGVLWK
jgi:hypothetical protein